MSYSYEQYFNMLMCLGKSDCNYAKARRDYETRFAGPQGTTVPSERAFQRLHHRVFKTGSVHGQERHRANSGRPRAIDSNTKKKIVELFMEDPTQSTRSVARQLGTNHVQVWKVLNFKTDATDGKQLTDDEEDCKKDGQDCIEDGEMGMDCKKT